MIIRLVPPLLFLILITGCASDTSLITPQPIIKNDVSVPQPGQGLDLQHDVNPGLDSLDLANGLGADDLLWQSESLEIRARNLDRGTLALELHSDAWLKLRTEVRNLQFQAFNLWSRSESLRRYC